MDRPIQRQEGLPPEVYLPLVDSLYQNGQTTGNFMRYWRCFHNVLEDGGDPSFILYIGNRRRSLRAWHVDSCLFTGAADGNNDGSR